MDPDRRSSDRSVRTVRSPAGYEHRSEWVLAAVCALLGSLSVSSLLAWTAGLGSFSWWFRLVSVPSVVALGVIAVVVHRRGPVRLRNALVAGAVGGLIGTALYDLVRQPFLVMGLRLMVPIDSYGVLALDAVGSSPWSGIAGWGYHVANGVGFGVTYAVLMRGRHWAWGVLWGLILEAAAVVTPFSAAYGLRWKWDLILIAFGAHVPYGAAVGLAAQHADRFTALLDRRWWTRAPVLLGATALVIVVWQRPFAPSAAVDAGIAVAPGPSVVIRSGTFVPELARIPPGGCVTVRNDDDEAHLISRAVGGPELAAGQTASVCFEGHEGMVRVKLDDGEPYSGGFVILDAHA
ncbi:MAG: hypothetical protein IPM45_14580 [Acidimicrobiales bacterium]|nr:hypothetical protein [Acidimicrobiales bacterium]